MSSMSIYHVYLILILYITSHSNQKTSSCLQVPLSLPEILPSKGKHSSQFAGDHSLPEVRDRNHHSILFKEPHQKRKKGKKRRERKKEEGAGKEGKRKEGKGRSRKGRKGKGKET